MKGRLTAIQLEYVLDHIGHHAELSDELKSSHPIRGESGPGLPFRIFSRLRSRIRSGGGDLH